MADTTVRRRAPVKADSGSAEGSNGDESAGKVTAPTVTRKATASASTSEPPSKKKAAAVAESSTTVYELPTVQDISALARLAPALFGFESYEEVKAKMARTYVAKPDVAFNGAHVSHPEAVGTLPVVDAQMLSLLCGWPELEGTGKNATIIDRAIAGILGKGSLSVDKVLELRTRHPDMGKKVANKGWMTASTGLRFNVFGKIYVDYKPNTKGDKDYNAVIYSIVAKPEENDPNTCGPNSFAAFLMLDIDLLSDHLRPVDGLSVFVGENGEQVSATRVSLGNTAIQYKIRNSDGGEPTYIGFKEYRASMAPDVMEVTITTMFRPGFQGDNKNLFKPADEKAKPIGDRKVTAFTHVGIIQGGDWVTPYELAKQRDWNASIDKLAAMKEAQEPGSADKRVGLMMMGYAYFGADYMSYLVARDPEGKNPEISCKTFRIHGIEVLDDLFRPAIYTPVKIIGDGGINPDAQLRDAAAAAASCAATTKSKVASSFADDD